MKKINRNLVVLIISFIIIVVGLSSMDTLYRFKLNVYELIFNTKNNSLSERIDTFISGVEKNANDVLYHDNCLDFNSFIYNKTNRKVVKKSDQTVVKLNNDYLSQARNYIGDKGIDMATDKVKELSEVAKENGADFLYVMCPQKGYSVSAPSFAKNHTKANYDRYYLSMKNKGIPTLNLQAKMDDDGLNEENAFFITDHHWKPNTGFWANGKICESLNETYGFEYEKDYTDISNFNVKTYEDWFLGSHGKKVGKYYSNLGIDDIDLITPKFSTNLTEEQPIKNEIRTGSFENSVLFMDRINEKDLYGKAPYAAYSGGDFRLQIFRNNMNETGKTFVIVRDSFASVILPFLSLQAKEIHIVDMRNFEWFVGEKINLYDYIESIKPDYVLVIYNGAGSLTKGDDRYNFD